MPFSDYNKWKIKIKYLSFLFVIFSAAKLGLGQLLWSPRTFTFLDAYDYSFLSPSPWILLSQYFTLFIFLSGAIIFISGFKRNFRVTREYRLLSLIWIILIFFALMSDWLSGRKSSLEHVTPLLIPFVGARLLHVEKIQLLDTLYYLIGLIIFGGLVAAVINPKWAFNFDYQSDFALFNLRFVGLLSHPNMTGALAGLLVIIGLAKSFRFKVFFVSCGLITLLISQSKTSIFATFLAYLIWIITINRQSKKFARAWVGFAAIVFLFGWLAYIILIVNVTNNELTSLTGRTEIWDEALKMWRAHPFFGGGQNVFNLDFRLKTALTGASSAHNQFLEILATTGLVGALAMTLLVSYMYKTIFKMKRMDSMGGAAAALLMFIFIRGITEPSLLSLGISVPFFSVFSLFLILSIKCDTGSNMPNVTNHNSTRLSPKSWHVANIPIKIESGL